MEEKAVYMTTEQVEELRAKVKEIEGLDEIRAAISAGEHFTVIDALRAKYPRAAV